MKNVLVLSAGRRVELVEAFLAELNALVPGAKVFAADLSPQLAPACQVADGAFAVPRVTNAEYCDRIIEICVVNAIGLVVPTIDTELMVLSERVGDFAARGIHLVISSPELVQNCRDKRKTAAFLEEVGIRSPRIYEAGNLTFPCFAKPYDGSCSVGASIVPGREHLTQDMLDNPRMMFAELIGKDHAEYTVDAYYNKAGELCCLVPRERIEVRGGEVSKGATRRHALYDFLLPRLKTIPGARGCLTFQFFAKVEEGRFLAIEINPRFGGGYPLSYAAGANYSGWLIREYLLNEEIGFFDQWEQDLLMLRYDAKVLVRNHVPA
ncbi:ATP-grasp domain-containing protein [Massilia varians]